MLIYKIINFALLVVLLVLVGRKPVVNIFRSRRERIDRELDEAEHTRPAPRRGDRGGFGRRGGDPAGDGRSL